MTEATVEGIRSRLLAWYEVEARDLPWRQTSDPYAIWISEVLLQQTQVETARSQYSKFLTRFPSVASLAAASVDDVLKAWEGFGYYRRARNLHAAARVVRDERGGQLPTTVAELRRLPGIGPYTAAAIASIAFGRDAPVLDGNTIRVLSRLRCVAGDPGRAAVRTTLRQVATNLLPPGDASRFNQALMDLGARICVPRPRAPRCDACPLSPHCDAHHRGETGSYPQRRARRAIPHVDVVGGVIWDGAPFSPGAYLLIGRRNENDLLGGLWEFPGGRVEAGESFEEALRRELREELGIQIEVLEPFLKLRHAYTHLRITLHVYHCRHIAGEPRAIDCADWAWASREQLRNYAFSTADRRVIDALERRLER